MSNEIDNYFYLGFKTASLDQPLPEDFIEKILQLPKKERDKAIQAKLQEWGTHVQNQIITNINEALDNLRGNQIEGKVNNMVEQKEKMQEKVKKKSKNKQK